MQPALFMLFLGRSVQKVRQAIRCPIDGTDERVAFNHGFLMVAASQSSNKAGRG